MGPMRRAGASGVQLRPDRLVVWAPRCPKSGSGSTRASVQYVGCRSLRALISLRHSTGTLLKSAHARPHHRCLLPDIAVACAEALSLAGQRVVSQWVGTELSCGIYRDRAIKFQDLQSIKWHQSHLKTKQAAIKNPQNLSVVCSRKSY